MSKDPTRDELRTACLSPEVDKDNVKIVEHKGVKVEVRACSIEDRKNLMSAAGLKAGKPNSLDQAKLQALSAIAMAYRPGTNEKIFEKADMDALIKRPIGGLVDKIGLTAMSFLQPNQEEILGNSEATPSSD